MLSFTEFCIKAKEIFGSDKHDLAGIDNPLSFLYSLDWNISSGEAFSEKKITDLNLNFDQSSCFGKALRAAVLAQKYFPDENFYFGEVCEDFFRTSLVSGATKKNWQDESYLSEILQYENPHVVILWKDKEFDPLFSILYGDPKKYAHPLVMKHDLWKGLYISYLISLSLHYLQTKQDANSCLELLNKCDTILPNILLVKENQIAALCSLHRFDEATEIAKSIYGKRKDAKAIWALWILTKESIYKTTLIKEYSIEMFNFLNKIP